MLNIDSLQQLHDLLAQVDVIVDESDQVPELLEVALRPDELVDLHLHLLPVEVLLELVEQEHLLNTN